MDPSKIRYSPSRDSKIELRPKVHQQSNAASATTSAAEEQSSKLKIWLAELRLPFITASIIPILLGASIAWATKGIFLWDFFLITLIGGICAHLGANVANDYFDYRSGTDNINVEFVRPFSGGSRMIQRGLLSPRAVLAGSLVFFCISGALGIYLAITRGFMVILLGVLGIFSGFFYTAPPLKLAHRGVGELFIGLSFGVLLTLGTYYVQVQILAWEPIIASIPIALLIAAVLYINEFPDYVADKEAGKLTLVVRLGRKRASILYAFLLLAAYSIIGIAVFLGQMSWYTLLALCSLPLSVLGIRYALIAYERPFELIPANAATVFNHMLTGLALVIAYILQGLSFPYLYVIAVSVLLLALAIHFSRKFHSQGKMAKAPTS
ncbi:MAG: 1,4-dihydroxy-2-naphthoate octaprenyltransferase [Promethearchaeota archaeon]